MLPSTIPKQFRDFSMGFEFRSLVVNATSSPSISMSKQGRREEATVFYLVAMKKRAKSWMGLLKALRMTRVWSRRYCLSRDLKRKASKRTSVMYDRRALLALTVALSLSLFVSGWAAIGFLRPRNLDRECITRQLPFSSPIDEALPPRFVEVDFSESFHKHTPYRSEPDEGVDRVWDMLGVNTNHLFVPASRAKDSGLNPHRHAHLKWSNTDGERGFTGHIALMFQLHCLKLIRKASHYDYDCDWAQGQALADSSPFSGGADSLTAF